MVDRSGSGATVTGAPVARVAPVVHGSRTIASVFATYRSVPTSTIPNGEFIPSANTARVSNHPFTPLLSSGRVGALVSATRTSPFGRTYSDRG
jgi:hypothetical protein